MPSLHSGKSVDSADMGDLGDADDSALYNLVEVRGLFLRERAGNFYSSVPILWPSVVSLWLDLSHGYCPECCSMSSPSDSFLRS